MRMTNKEVMDALRSNTELNRARAVFSSECAKIEHACLRRSHPGPIEIHRMEFEAVRRIIAALSDPG